MPLVTKTGAARARADFIQRVKLLWALPGGPELVVGSIAIGTLIAVAVTAGWIAPFDPAAQESHRALEGPSGSHLLGTDNLGRDILSRTIYGTQVSLLVGFVSVAVAASLGMLIALFTAYRGGILDAVVMRIADGLLAFPALALALGLAAALGASVSNVVLALVIVQVPQFARVARGQVISVRRNEFIEAAISIGASQTRVVFRHVLPQILTPLLIQAALYVGYSIVAESTLSFLGLGIQPPTPSWGSMVQTGYRYLEVVPLFSIVPGAAITATVVASSALSVGLGKMLDPRQRKTLERS